jgi:hypothetical protein
MKTRGSAEDYISLHPRKPLPLVPPGSKVLQESARASSDKCYQVVKGEEQIDLEGNLLPPEETGGNSAYNITR